MDSRHPRGLGCVAPFPTAASRSAPSRRAGLSADPAKQIEDLREPEAWVRFGQELRRWRSLGGRDRRASQPGQCGELVHLVGVDLPLVGVAGECQLEFGFELGEGFGCPGVPQLVPADRPAPFV